MIRLNGPGMGDSVNGPCGLSVHVIPYASRAPEWFLRQRRLMSTGNWDRFLWSRAVDDRRAVASAEFERANDEIAQAAADLGAFGSEVPFICECPDRDCFQRVPLTVAAYEEHRGDGCSVLAHAPDLRVTR